MGKTLRSRGAQMGRVPKSRTVHRAGRGGAEEPTVSGGGEKGPSRHRQEPQEQATVMFAGHDSDQRTVVVWSWPQEFNTVLYLRVQHSPIHHGDTVQNSIQQYSTEQYVLVGWICTAVKPKKGSALLLFNLLPNGQHDTSSGFVECQVAAGERWVASKFIAVQRYSERRDPNACVDEHEQCETWARAGECQKNPKFMVGAAGYMGNCRKACKACTPKVK